MKIGRVKPIQLVSLYVTISIGHNGRLSIDRRGAELHDAMH
jgi:hypothetical protein